jgi:2-polyprenyl-3-methyl-5-hydroxy-6-metoxy-1,4-benzoquinol methylase
MLKKQKGYFSNIRCELIECVRDGDNKILEIGCGQGDTGKALKEQGKAAVVVGIEKVPEIAEAAKAKIDQVLTGDVEVIELSFSEGYFDYVIMGDVLEHLYDPWALVNKVGRYVKKGGYVIASIPNIRYWQIVKELVLKGEWRYCSEGVLDETHLRFFTKKSMIRLFESGPFTVSRIIPASKFRPQPLSKQVIVNKLTFGLFEDFFIMQYIVEAQRV